MKTNEIKRFSRSILEGILEEIFNIIVKYLLADTFVSFIY